MSDRGASAREIINRLVNESGAANPEAAIRLRAQELIQLYDSIFGPPNTPVNLDALAQLRGISHSTERPAHSDDAELVPDGTGGVTMRINPDRPLTRQRFSIAHEISHTFFPDYESKAWCRPDARYRDRTDPDQYLEMLCDIGASELLFPSPWFPQSTSGLGRAAEFVQLAADNCASKEATLRRFAECTKQNLFVVFFDWKLKPTQQGLIGNEAQTNFLDLSPEDEVRDAIRLRVEYTVPSTSFADCGTHIPKDKSVPSVGAMYEAAASGQPVDAEEYVDLGPARGTFRIAAIPLWAPDDERGPNGENVVAAVLWPSTDVRPSRRRPKPASPPATLF